MTIFAMVTTQTSDEYTGIAVESFFRYTPFTEDDCFFLIDNDATGIAENLRQDFQRIQLIINAEPRSYAANANALLRIAQEKKADVVFLNNDLVFSFGWYEEIVKAPFGIVSPVSNREFQYQAGTFSLDRALAIENYQGKDLLFQALAIRHREQHAGYQCVFGLPFFCIFIPYDVHSQVGLFDERFGKGGAEDMDYCIRAALEGIPVTYALGSYILHFNGRSTWATESEEETKQRCDHFRSSFEEKWGSQLTRLLIDLELELVTDIQDEAVKSAISRGEWKVLVEKLRTDN